MCKAFEEVRDKAREEKEFSNIKTLMETMSLTAQQAMDALRVPAEEQAKYAKML